MLRRTYLSKTYKIRHLLNKQLFYHKNNQKDQVLPQNDKSHYQSHGKYLPTF